MIGFRLSAPYTLDFRAPLGADFDLSPEQAIAYFQGKGLKPSFSWMDMIGEEHDVAFTVAKMADLDMLTDVRAAVDEAISTGKSVAWFREQLDPILQAKGWWGRQEVIDPLTGKTIVAQLGSPRRLEQIFRTNMQAAYSAGQWDVIAEEADVAPWLLYDAIDDSRTRPEHEQWDDTLLPVTDPFWRTHMPPNGWNCRCGITQLSDAQVEEFGLTPSRRPDDGTYTWRNPRTGKKHRVPKGLDPGWDNNPGVGRPEAVAELFKQKAANYPTPLKAAADSAALAAAEAASKAQVLEANKAVAQQIGKQALKEGKEQAIQRGALYTLEAAKDTKQPYLAAAIKQVEGTKAAAGMSPKQILDAATEKAVKAKQAADLAHYKQAKLKGKKPGTAAQAAYDDAGADIKAKIDADIAEAANKAQEALAAAAAEAEAKDKLADILTNPKGQTLKNKTLLAKLGGKDLGAVADPAALLKEVEEAAAEAQAKASRGSALSGYKKKALLGQPPTAAQLKAIGELKGDELTKFTKGLIAEKEQLDDFAAKYLAIYGQAPSKKELEGFLKSKKATKASTLKTMQAQINDLSKTQAAAAP